MSDTSEERSDAPFIVAIGASAGGLEALTQMLEKGPRLTGMAIVLVQHLSPDHKSLMPELLARHTDMRVVRADSGVVPKADTMYVIEPDTVLTFRDGALHVAAAHKEHGQLFLPINMLFESLAAERGAHCAVVVLSGTGSDGAVGLRSAKSHDAVTIVQAPESARFDGMPRAALATGAVDLVLPPDQILGQLLQVHEEGPARYFSAAAGHGVLVMTRVLAALRTHTGIDFSYYKPATVLRRVERRMMELGVDDARAYADQVFADAAEARRLQQLLLIGVTRFFRDQGAIDALQRLAIPRLLSQPREAALRIWVPGCSTGEEAYTLAMLLQSAIEDSGSSLKFKLFATDVDPRALEKASLGEFPEEAAAQLPESFRERFFTRRDDTLIVSKGLREKLLFSRHDLILDPPFSHLDMITCRNLLIYLKPPIQDRILRVLSSALRDGGLLWLGASESLGEGAEDFETLDSRWRLYVARSERKRSLMMPLNASRAPVLPELPQRARRADAVRQVLEVLQQDYVPPCLVVDGQGRLLYRFGRLQSLLEIPEGAVTLDLRELLPSRLALLVFPVLARVQESGDVVYRNLEIETGTARHRFDLRARAIALPEHPPLVALFFESLRDFTPAPFEVPHDDVLASEARTRVEMLERELLQSRESLQATIEELESSNEELQATNEELIASNEELQSTNEELQSVNEELHTVNAEFSSKLNEVTRLNEDLDRLFGSVEVGILLLDEKLSIRRFNSTAARYVHVLAHDVGRPLRHLSHTLAYPTMLDDCARALGSGAQVRRRVTADDGSQVLVQISGHGELHGTPGVVVTLTDVSTSEQAQRQLGRLASAFERSPSSICVVDESDRIIYANTALERLMQREERLLRNEKLLDLMPPGERSRMHDAFGQARTGQRWRGVVRGGGGTDGTYFELVNVVPTSEGDQSVVRIGELLTRKFRPYDLDRGPEEPPSIGPLCYGIWSDVPEHRVIDERIDALLDDDARAAFIEGDLARMVDDDDVSLFTSLFAQPRTSADVRVRPRAAPSDRCLQVRTHTLPSSGAVDRLLVELAELAGGARGPRSLA